MTHLYRLRLALLRPFARRLDVRIVALFLGLLLLVQLAGFVSIRYSIEANAKAQIAGELRTGENVLRRLLAQNAQQLSDGARLLAADYGFRSAISSNDRATIIDALDNHGTRIGAGVALFTDLERRPIAAAQLDTQQVMSLVQSNLRVAMQAGADTTVRVLGGEPYQLVTVPVRAPQLIGHVSMGFPVNAALLGDMESLTPLQMGMLVRPLGGTWAVLPIGARTEKLAALPAQLAGRNDNPDVMLEAESYSAHLVPLARDASHEVAAVLLRSVDEAVAPYRRLQLTLLVITLAGAFAFGLGSLVTARRITGPIKALSASAERLGAGDYATPITVTTRDEVRDLAQAFETMRGAVQEREAQVRRLAYWDALTGLPNRAQLRERLQAALRSAQAQHLPCAVLMLDLDRFKHINDVLGHAFGDRVLQRIAERLSSGVLREGDVAARLSGDEFALCLPRADADAARAAAQRIRHALEQPLWLDDQAVDVGAGIGVALYPQHGVDADTLLGRAEVAMYAAKAQQSGVRFYAPELDSASAESLSLLGELRQAVDGDQLRLYLQPKVDLASGQVIGAEALVRWQHPQRGLVQPMRFIPFAEQTGFIRVLTAWMIQRCIECHSALREQGIDLKFAVNLSTRDLLDNDLPVKLERLLVRNAVSPSSFGLEITESGIMEDPQRALLTVRRLHDMGFTLSIDDFGTGYSSLAYLKQLPLHELKIDKSFVMAMESDRADLKIVRSTIDLAHNLGLRVVAEGVENAQVWALLRAMGCDHAQGFGIAKPMPETAFAGWLTEWAAPEARLRSEFADLV
ncbi:MAG: EAL domain-containing protein [Pseudomonadota bacterium]